MSKRQNTMHYRHLLHFQTYKAYTLLLILSLFSCCLHAADTTAYTYDALGRLTVVRQNGAVVEGYEYDQAGNRCKVSAAEPSANICSAEGSSYTSTWNYGATNSATSFQTSDTAFQLVWSPASLNGLIELREYQFRHRLPNSSVSTNNVGLTYSKSVSNLSTGTHSFEIHACGVLYYDDNEYEVTGCSAWMKINVTII